jgi:rRNA small subunit aminocarboxypropyltransferase
VPQGDSPKTLAIDLREIDSREQAPQSPQLYVLQLRQDDPKKCTAAKLVKFRLARPLYRVKQVPEKSLTLNPFAPTCLLNQDRVRALNYGLVAVDCSWEKVQATFAARLPGRNVKLPTLLASNPVNYAKPSKLSSLEALAASLHIMGFREKANQLLSIFKWGPHFLTLNAQPLEAYASAPNEQQLMKAESEFF